MRTNKRIRELNDLCRSALGAGGRLVQTNGILALPPEEQLAIGEKVKSFNKFNADNDPYGEHDFGSFKHAGSKIFWKIEYYNPKLEHHSDNPADTTKTIRVLTIMLGEEYLPHHHSRASR